MGFRLLHYRFRRGALLRGRGGSDHGASNFLGRVFAHDRLREDRWFRHDLFHYRLFHCGTLDGNWLRVFSRNSDRRLLAFTGLPGVPVSGLFPVGTFAARLLVWTALLLHRPVATPATAAAAATFLAGTLGGTITGLALFHSGQCRILTSWLGRLLLAILWLAFALLLIAVATLIAAVVCVLARTPALLVALVAGTAALWTAVSMLAALRIATSLRVSRPGFHRLGFGLRFAGKPAEYLFQDRGFDFFARSHHGRWLGRRNALHCGLRTLRLWLLDRS
jgi:hypothetical protein